MIDEDEWQRIADESNARSDAASKLVEDRLGADYHDDYFATAKLTLWVYDQHLEIERLRAENLRLRTALDNAGYALFQIKRLVPESTRDFAREAHREVCRVLDDIRDKSL
jgi:hypothetical protein